MNLTDHFAPGGPGIPPRWTSSAKTAVGTSISNRSHVWFTLSHGIFDEIYYPCIDQAAIRDMGLIVTDGSDFFSEEKKDAESKIQWLAEGVPAFRLVNTCRKGRYQIEKKIVTDPHRDALLQQVHFVPKQGELADYHLYVLVAPHLENQGDGNSAWVGEFEGTPLLFAQRNDRVVALACSSPWIKRSVGYVGTSDGWQDLKAHKEMTWEYTRAEKGNIAMTAEINLAKSRGTFVLALGFGKDPEEAARKAIHSLKDGFDRAKDDYVDGWHEWFKTHALKKKKSEPGTRDLSKISLAVLRTHESKTTLGGIIASLAIPWGFSKGDKDIAGYHLIWSRDMVEMAGGLISAGAYEDVRRALTFLQKTQQPDGHWPQNMWLDGSAYLKGIQMDETALPILLLDLGLREKALTEADSTHFWPMVRKAVNYLVHNGPVSQQDRWEEDPGYTPFTLAAEIAALLVAADLADLHHESSLANYLRETADVWNTSIERWMYVSNTDWSQKFQVEGYYVRIASMTGESLSQSPSSVNIKNVPGNEDTRLARHLVGPDFLALVRFGLRSADDPRILNTIKVIDSLLKIETPTGPTWHRYNDDGYGEHEDGAPFDGTGIGRGWALLTGERAHYELAAGRLKEAQQLMAAMESFAGEGGLIPEQIWDSSDIPERELYLGRPSGSAMPLGWAHAEYLKLRRSLHDGEIFDRPPQTVKRYLKEKTVSPRLIWRFNHKIRSLPFEKILRIETMAPVLIHWSSDQWKTVHDTTAKDVGLGMYVADLPTQKLPLGTEIKFTFYWTEAKRWEGKDFVIPIVSA